MAFRRRLFLVLALLLLLTPGHSRAMEAKKAAGIAVEAVSWPIKFLRNVLTFTTTDLGDKVILYLPSVDTDPNRGVTAGAMPVLLLKDRETRGIRQIHAPSLTFNEFFRWTPTWRIYHYPDAYSQWFLRGSYSQKTNQDLTVEYINSHFLDHNCFLDTRFQYFRDGSRRFFGTGPDSREPDQSNYTLDTLRYHATLGLPIRSPLRVDLTYRIQADQIGNGPVDTIADLSDRFPGRTFSERKNILRYRAALTYDSRDNLPAPQRGFLWSTFAESSSQSLGSDANYQTFGSELRFLKPHNPSKTWISVGRVLLEQQVGRDIPFYLQSQLGGKESLRGFGDGRFVDKGKLAVGFEERIRMTQLTMMDVLTQLEIDPFFEFGTVFGQPKVLQFRNLEAVGGVAIRAVVRPQVVGSLDIGIGREGAAVFVDINYSF